MNAASGLDDARSGRLRRFIQDRLPVVEVPATGGIRLHLAGPRSGMARLAEIDPADAGPPYWAYLWGGGLALARHLQDNPAVVAGRRVLDLGCGGGLVGIAAARAGAHQVIAADIAPGAVAATSLNAMNNGVTITPVLGDLTAGTPLDVDVVLVGDLFYEDALATRVAAFLDRCLATGIAVLIGDPGRAQLPHGRLERLAEYPGPDFGTGEAARQAPNAVFAWRGHAVQGPSPEAAGDAH